MKYCPFCGAGLQDSMQFCPKCGKKFLDAAENPEAAEDITVESPVSTEPIISIEAQPEPVEDSAPAPASTVPKKSKGKLIAAVVALVLIIGAVGIYAASRKSVDIAEIANSVLYLEVYDDADNITATASGFIIEDGQTLVTNYHVIEGAYSITAWTPDGEHSVEIHDVLAYDETADLAILKCEEDIGVPSLTLGDSDTVNQGDSIYAAGYPLGLAHTLSDGVVSSRYIDENDVDVIQITAAISSGSSGGALFNEDGEVVGVICASYVDGQNLNIAISSSYIASLMSDYSPLALSSFFTPTYSVEYVINHKEDLLNKEFYIIGWVSAYGYTDYRAEGYDSDSFNGWANIYNSAEDVPYKTRPRDDVYESIHYRDKYITVYSPDDQPCDVLATVDTGDAILVKGSITLRYSEFSDGVSMYCTEFSFVP